MSNVRIDRHDHIAVLTIDRPEVRNALDPATLHRLHDLLGEFDRDRTVRAVVLTGAGDRAFSAGLDLRAAAEQGLIDPSTSPVNLLRNGYRKPVIAAVNGPAVGGGFELALACDLMVVAEHAYFALPEVTIGIAASEGGTDLPLRLPAAIALELGLGGGPLTADRALAFGLANAVVPGPAVLETAIGLAGRIANNSPAAVLATKALMRLAQDAPAADRRAANLAATARLLAGPDAAEGSAAFLAKRAPVWADPA